MIVIDPKGLQEGERLAACSDLAQLHYPRLLLSSNGFGRMELSYPVLVSTVYRSFSTPPSEDQLWRIFEEYATNHLVIIYEVNNVWWAQFDTSEKYLPRYKTARDQASPWPPSDLVERHRNGYVEWKRAKSISNQRFRKFSENSRNLPKISAAVAVAVADAVAKKNTPKASPSPFALPPSIPAELWKDFEEMRSKIRAPMTDRARRGVVDEILRLKELGHDPEAVLLQSISNSYRGVFPLKNVNGNGSHAAPPKLQILSRPGGAA